MKKYLYFATVAIAALALNSCGEQPQQKTVAMKYHAREIAIGDEIKAEVIAPADAKLIFTSSAPTVASVTSFGIINGLAKGSTIIYVEAEGLGKDSMLLNVCEASELFTLGGFTLWDLDETKTTGNFRDSVELSDGTKPVCKLCPGEWHVWDNNLSYDGSTGRISGAGYVIILENVPTYVIDDDNYFDGKYNGYYIGTRTLRITETATGDSAYRVKPGKFIDAAKWADYVDGKDTTLTLADCIYDQAMHYIDYVNQEGYYYQAFVGEGIIYGGEAAAMYKQNIKWLGGIYGLAYDESVDPETGKPTYEIRRPVEVLETEVYYELWEEDDEDEDEADAPAIKRFVAPVNNFQVSKNVKTTDRFYIKK